MRFSLVICTYMRPEPLKTLLGSVASQTKYPDEILIIDGSTNDATQHMLSQSDFHNIVYHRVADTDRGLTRQRNFGIARCASQSHVICFLDDDTLLTPRYFEALLETYTAFPVGSSRVDLQACKLEYSIVSPK